MKKRLVFIYNPNAGKAKIKSKLSDIVVEFSKFGYEVIVLPTGKRGMLQNLPELMRLPGRRIGSCAPAATGL